MSDVKLGILLWSQAATWNEMLDAARRVDRLGLRPPVDVGSPLRDLRRPVPADLRGLVAAQRMGPRDGADTTRAARRGQYVPEPGHRRQDRRDARPRQRRPGDPGHRRGVDGARAHGPRHRLRDRLRPASRLARRIGRRDAARARRRVGHLRARRALPVQRPAPQPAAGPEAAADHDRRQRREEDPADGRALRRHVERDGHDRHDEAQDRGPPGPLRRRRARHRRDRVHARRQGHDPRHRSRGRSASGRPRWSTTRRHSPTSRTTRRSGTGPRSSSPTGSRPYTEIGFRTVISEQPAPYDVETLERFIGEVVPLLD